MAEKHTQETFAHTVVTKCIAIAVCTKNANFDETEYEKGVIEPFRRVQALQERIEKEKRSPTREEMRQALAMLQSVLTTKKIPAREQQERFEEIRTETGETDLIDELLTMQPDSVKTVAQ